MKKAWYEDNNNNTPASLTSTLSQVTGSYGSRWTIANRIYNSIALQESRVTRETEESNEQFDKYILPQLSECTVESTIFDGPALDLYINNY
tara:strand:- start:783 stop:1055 length:273 start_codon:yes stop_codon:yes gene_type:complete